MAREEQTPSFLHNYMAYGEGIEVPQLFTLWCGLSGISSALGKRVWIDYGRFKIYPNLFVVLVAVPGRMRKSTGIREIRNILKRLQPAPLFLPPKVTPERLIDILRGPSAAAKAQAAAAQKLLLSGPLTEAYSYIDELSNFINKTVYEGGMGPLLIALYDGEEDFSYSTKSGGDQRLPGICYGLLGASTVYGISSSIPEAAVGDGLTSRFIFVYVQEPAKPIAWPTANLEAQEKLVVDLQKIAGYSGGYTFEPDATELYTRWYENWQQTSPLFEDKALFGYAGRRHIHLLKLAMLLSAGERDDLVIKEDHMVVADRLLSEAEKAMPTVMRLITSSAGGNMLETIYDMINHRAEGITGTELLNRVSNRISKRDLDEFLLTLSQSGRIRFLVQGNSGVYTSIDKGPQT